MYKGFIAEAEAIEPYILNTLSNTLKFNLKLLCSF